MRLRENEIQSIKTIFRDIFKDGEIYLFGSRVDDSKKGGDIDLYISTKNRDNLAQKKIKFAGRVMRAIMMVFSSDLYSRLRICFL